MVWFMPTSSIGLPKVVVGVPQVLKVFSWVFIYKFHKKTVFGPKTSVKTSSRTPSMIENFQNFPKKFQTFKTDLNIALIHKIRAHLIISFK